MNQVTLFGKLGSDPETRTSKGGLAILRMSVATSERVKKGEQWEDHTEWHRVTVFGRKAEWLSQRLMKGSGVLVIGKLRTSSYEKNGEKRYRTEILADDVQLGAPPKNAAPPKPANGEPSVVPFDVDIEDTGDDTWGY